MLLGAVFALSILIGAVVCAANGAFATLQWLWLLPVTFLGSFLSFALVIFLGLLVMCKLVDQDKPQEDDDKFYRFVATHVIAAALPLLQVHIKKFGMEKVPKEGRFLLICNHTDDSDPIILLNCFPKKQLAFIAKREARTTFIVGPMMHKLQCQLINRENDREALKTILRCIQILKEDKASIGVFPEGRIDDDKLLHRFRPGVFKIAQKAGVPIVVCTLKNAQHVVHDLLRMKPSHVELHVLEVLSAEKVKAMNTVDIAEYCHGLMAESLGAACVGD